MTFDFTFCQFCDTHQSPDKLALIGSNGELSWGDLHHKTNQLVSTIQELKLPKGYPIFIYGHKEVEFPVAILACLVTNHPFVPIDRLYPKERIAEIQSETNSSVIVDCSRSFQNSAATVLTFWDQEIVTQPGEITKSIVPVFEHNPLAYLLFTSGSTGKPKGVMIRQSSVLDLVNWIHSDAFGMNSQEVFVNQSPFSFDVSLFDTFSALSYGATMLMVSQDLVKDTELFKTKLVQYNASFWTSTPSFVYLYLREQWFQSGTLPSLKTFLFAGEPLPVATCKSLYTQFEHSTVFNAYGPTEATVITTLLTVDKTSLDGSSSLPIGHCKPHSEMITLAPGSKEHPQELVIVGENVAEGYLNRPEQTADRFFVHEGKKAYKTGDLGFVEKDMIYCQGRNDNQIKLNGYRIELDEINEKILSMEGINEARTIGLKRNDKVVRIVSLVQSAKTIDVTELKQTLSQLLPHYMVPSDYVQVADFPKNPSGKIDRNGLQEFYLTQKKAQKK
jgi:D-alanine--poly(phosphoribitol) ligase subunit 1